MLDEVTKKEVHEKRHGFWWHSQSLKEDMPHKWLAGRASLHKRPRGEVGLEWVFPGRFDISVEVGGHHQLCFTLGLILFTLYLHIDGFKCLNRTGYEGRDTGINWFMWSLHWHVWTDPDSWSSTTPKWRDGHFDIPDFFLGRNTYSKVDQEPILVTLPMPEGNYAASVTFFTQTWKRPRWHWPLIRNGGTVDIPNGIPIPGKGENAWDCDDDAFLSIGTSATTVEGAIQQVIESVNERRERYGGKNWLPEKVKDQ